VNTFLTETEIASQPAVWRSSLESLAALDAVPRPGDHAGVLFTGCGSTHYLSQWAARVLSEQRGAAAQAVPASELMLRPASWLVAQPTLLVAISRSARTTETIRAVERYRQEGLGPVAVITCEPSERLAQLGDWVLAVPEAAEQTVPQTRSFTTMLLAAARLILGPSPDGLADALAAEAHKMLTIYQEGLPAPLRAATTFSFLGSGRCYGLAAEAMLKTKEMSLATAEVFHALEFRHGPISTVDLDRTVVLFADGPDAPATELERAVLDETARLGAATVAVGPGLDPDRWHPHTVIPFDAAVPAPWRDVLYLPVAQRTAVALAAGRGLNPDRPANLAAVVVLDD
jgi:glutamine---fructose-6-phosphate transaminase (isomerizing)